jgi:hypothetical protein
MELISKKEAKAKGLSRYFTGKPCPSGHVAERDIHGHCNKCGLIRQLEYYQNHKEKINQYNKQYYQQKRTNNPKQCTLSSTKYVAKKKGLKFNLTLKDIPDIPKKCPYLGITLIPGSKTRSDNSPSLDRIDNLKGYIKGNVQIISWRANKIKSNATADELIAIGNAMKKGQDDLGG